MLEMKKIVIILSAIMLNVAVGFAQIAELQQAVNTATTAYNTAENLYKKDTANVQAKQSRDSLLQVKNAAEQKLQVAQQELTKVFDGTYKRQLASLQAKANTLQQSTENIFSWDKILLFILAVLVIGLLAFIVIDKKGRRDEITLTSRKIVEKTVAQLKQNQLDVSHAESYDNETARAITDLQSRVANLEDSKKETERIETAKQEEIKAAINQPKTLFADAIVGDRFNKVVPNPNEETIYELLLKTPSATTAEFTLYEGNKKQVLRNADKIDGCEKTGTNAGATNIQIEKGTAVLQEDGKWKITNKAKIKFVQ